MINIAPDKEAVMSSDYKSMFISDKNRKKLIPLGYKYYEGEYSPDSAYSIWI